MQMPSRKNYDGDGTAFLADIDKWCASSEASYKSLREMYDLSWPSPEKAEWITNFTRGDREPGDAIINVSVRSTPSEEGLEVVLRNLSGSADHKGKKIARICHGVFDGEWCCYADLKD